MVKKPTSAAGGGPGESFNDYLKRLEVEVAAAEADHVAAKGQAKKAKEVVAERVAKLRAAVRSGKLPLFDAGSDDSDD